MTAFVLIGRVGARITAELGTMAVSEQLDALYSPGRDPVAILAAPRLLAGLLTTPLLVGIANTVGVLAGLVAAQVTAGLGPEAFLYGARVYWRSWNLFYSIMKAGLFGFVIPIISLHMGLITHWGAEGGRGAAPALPQVLSLRTSSRGVVVQAVRPCGGGGPALRVPRSHRRTDALRSTG
jgi:phospholipid/cholesterol/gamma-HCH transport system permease protein